MDRCADEKYTPRHSHYADAGAHPLHDRHDRDHTRPAFLRALSAGAWIIRPAGGRRLVLPTLQPPAATHPRICQHPAPDFCPAGSPESRRGALSNPLSWRGLDRAGQAAEKYAAWSPGFADLSGGDWPEECGADRRDCRRLAADLLLARTL